MKFTINFLLLFTFIVSSANLFAQEDARMKYSKTMKIGDRLVANQTLVSECKDFQLRVTEDGRAVVEFIIDEWTGPENGVEIMVVKRTRELWSAPLRGGAKAGPNAILRLQKEDGNFCFYNKDMGFQWCAMTNSKNVTHMTMANDGRLVVYSDDTEIWATPRPKFEIGDEVFGGRVWSTDDSGETGLVYSYSDAGAVNLAEADKMVKAMGAGWEFASLETLTDMYNSNIARDEPIFGQNQYWSSKKKYSAYRIVLNFADGKQADGFEGATFHLISTKKFGSSEMACTNN